MDVRLFLEYLPWLRMPKLYFEMAGYAPLEPDPYTTVKPRKVAINLSDAPAQIRALYENHDLSSVHLLGTYFLDKPKKMQEGWCFAHMSEVNIVHTPSGRVEAYNAHPISTIPGDSDCLGVLAKDIESYLEALLCGKMNKGHFSPGFADEDPLVKAKLEPIVQLCTVIAGGDEYHDFWAGILGL